MALFGKSTGWKQRNEMDASTNRALQQMSVGAIGNRFQGLQGLASPFLNQMAASQGLQGQAQAGAAMANMGRMGLGGTGLGSALGAGLQAGSAFQGNQIRARMFQDLLGQASAQQMGIGQGLMGLVGQKASTYVDPIDQVQKYLNAGQSIGEIGMGAMTFGQTGMGSGGGGGGMFAGQPGNTSASYMAL